MKYDKGPLKLNDRHVRPFKNWGRENNFKGEDNFERDHNLKGRIISNGIITLKGKIISNCPI
jgi:hypothetical protein